jgi:hypothetical protein
VYVNAPPSSGTFYVDNPQISSIANIRIDQLAINNVSYEKWLLALLTAFNNGQECYLQICEVGTTNIIGIATIDFINDAGTYYEIKTNFFVSNGSLTQNKTYTVSWVYHGKSGVSGSSGTSGTSGVQANSYVTLPIVADVPTWTPADGANYFIGGGGVPAPAGQRRRIFIFTPGIIEIVHLWSYTITRGSAENISMYIRKNNASDTLIETVGLMAYGREWDNTGLSIPVASGDYIEIKMVCPSWATNPVFEALNGYVLVRV